LGKIFDALEKAGKEPPKKTLTPHLRTEVPVKEAQDTKKIMLLKNKDRNNPEMEPPKAGGFDQSEIHPSIVCASEPNSFESEQFKMLRSKVLFPSSGKPPRTIIVTSAIPGEGKSFVAANLAVSIAQNINEYVLLMDCDLRLPQIGKLFGVEQRAGLSEYLAGEENIRDLLVKTSIKKLTVLTGGSPPPNPAELLSSQRMGDLIQEVRERYSDRYIIIDAPPPHITAEARVMANKVDGIILVVRYGQGNRKMVKDLTELIDKNKIIGVVFNGVKVPVFNYYGYGKYGKYGKYKYAARPG
jgi:protein-tyrosine kinase